MEGKRNDIKHLIWATFLYLITLTIIIGWIKTPTSFSIDLSMDNNTVAFSENVAELDKCDDEKKHYIGRQEMECCGVPVEMKFYNITDEFEFEFNNAKIDIETNKNWELNRWKDERNIQYMK